jgi:hypothetical protein
MNLSQVPSLEESRVDISWGVRYEELWLCSPSPLPSPPSSPLATKNIKRFKEEKQHVVYRKCYLKGQWHEILRLWFIL